MAQKLMQLMVRIFFFFYFRIVEKPTLDSNMKKTLAMYKSGEFGELFTYIRLWDAPFKEINKIVPKSGKVLDLGSGDGILANYLAVSSKKRRVTGIEISKDRHSESDHFLPNTKFIVGSIVEKAYPKSDTILLVHVLHHLSSREDQEVVLEKAHKALKAKGRLVVVEISEKPLLKYLFTWITDAITVPILFEHRLFNLNFHYRKDKEWVKLLKEKGFSCSAKLAHKGKPFSHIILECYA